MQWSLPAKRRQRLLQWVGFGVCEVALVVALFWVHEVLRGLAMGTREAATANAELVIAVERAVGLFQEAHLQAWVLEHPRLIDIFNWIYVYVHLPATLLFGLGILCLRPHRFVETRNIYLTLLAVAIPVYWLFPLAPPRYFPDLGFVDTVKLFSSTNFDANADTLLYNPFAAMPSMHVAFALFVALGVIRLSRSRLRWAALGYWVLVNIVVVGTGNHYIVDGIAGSLLTLAAYVLVPRLSTRLRRPSYLPWTGITLDGW